MAAIISEMAWSSWARSWEGGGSNKGEATRSCSVGGSGRGCSSSAELIWFWWVLYEIGCP